MHVVLAVCGTHKYFGMPKYFYLLAKYLKQKGIEVSLVIDSKNGLEKAHEICDVETIVVNPEVRNALSTAIFCHSLADYLIDNPDFDVLHTCHVNPFFYLMHGNRKPVVFQPFGNELFTLAGKGLNRAYCKLAQPILRYCGHNADMLLAEGQFQWDEMVDIYDNEARTAILPVGIETNVPQQTNYKSDVLKILAVNSLLPYEGMDLLIDAFRIVCGDIEASLTIVGTGSLEWQLKKQAADLPVTFLKNMPEASLQRLYAGSDLFVSTSGESDTQMGILEAEAAGLPIVSTGQHWLIKDNGIVCARTPDKIANAILSICRGNRYAMGMTSKIIAREYDFANIARSAIKIYERIA